MFGAFALIASASDNDDAMSLLQVGVVQEHHCADIPTPCPAEGKGGTDDCPKGCKYIESCDLCEHAAKFWKRKYGGANNWRKGLRPHGCFRNRKWQIKCNDKGPFGGFRGKWPVCQQICGHPRWAGTKYEKSCVKVCTTTTTTPTPTTTPTTTKACVRCSSFSCPAKYSLRSGAESICGADRASCCIKDGLCTNQSVGAKCGDGDIDLSIIANPSFEEKTCCPKGFSQLKCAVDWHQATKATSDYWVDNKDPKCGNQGRDSGMMFSPDAFDGHSYVGALFQYMYVADLNEDSDWIWHEYVGTCLKEPLKPGVTYTMHMQAAAGFTSAAGGATDGLSDVLCLDTCTFPDPGVPNPGRQPTVVPGDMSGKYPVLGTAKPPGGLVVDGTWKPLVFETVAPAGGCKGLMIGPNKKATHVGMHGGRKMVAPYILYDYLNLHEGIAGTCDAQGQCVSGR